MAELGGLGLYLLFILALIMGVIGLLKPSIPLENCEHDWSKWSPKPWAAGVQMVRVCRDCAKIEVGKHLLVREEDAIALVKEEVTK